VISTGIHEAKTRRCTSLPSLGLVAKRVDSEPFWLHTDRLGSIQAITGDDGALTQRMTYRPYGDEIAEATEHLESRGYIGQRQDPETDLTYLHARYYDAELGLFLSPDPIGTGLSTYTYSALDPVNQRDPSGLCHDGYTIIRYDEKGQPYESMNCPTGDVHHGGPTSLDWLLSMGSSGGESENKNFESREERMARRALYLYLLEQQRLARLPPVGDKDSDKDEEPPPASGVCDAACWRERNANQQQANTSKEGLTLSLGAGGDAGALVLGAGGSTSLYIFQSWEGLVWRESDGELGLAFGAHQASNLYLFASGGITGTLGWGDHPSSSSVGWNLVLGPVTIGKRPDSFSLTIGPSWPPIWFYRTQECATTVSNAGVRSSCQ
jgi:RHS repeat-associated protein